MRVRGTHYFTHLSRVYPSNATILLEPFIVQVGFQHLFDYEMYEWAVGDGDEYGENGCAVLFDCLPEEAGHYVMCYYSYKLDCVISVSDPFEVR